MCQMFDDNYFEINSVLKVIKENHLLIFSNGNIPSENGHGLF